MEGRIHLRENKSIKNRERQIDGRLHDAIRLNHQFEALSDL